MRRVFIGTPPSRLGRHLGIIRNISGSNQIWIGRAVAT